METEERDCSFGKRLLLIIIAIILIIFIIFLLLRRCGNNSSVPNLLGIELSSYNLNMVPGETEVLFAQLMPSDATPENLIWSVADQVVATVDDAGNITAVAEGETVVTVTAEQSGVTASCTVVVADEFAELAGILLSKKSYTIRVGRSFLVNVTPVPDTAQYPDLKYQINDTDIAAVNEYGVVTGLKVGTTTLKVTTADDKFETSAEIEVTPVTGSSSGNEETKPTSIELIDGASKSLKVGESYNIPVKVNPSKANQDVVCTIDNNKVLTEDNCLITAAKAGSAIVKVCVKDNTKLCVELKVTVTESTSGGSTTTLDAPTVSFKCGTANYTSGTWCNSGLTLVTEGIPSGSYKKVCKVSGNSQCNPFESNNYTTITTSGTYTVCAGYTKNNKNSAYDCEKVVAKIDMVKPTCSLSMLTENVTSPYTVVATVAENESGIKSVTSGWTKATGSTYRETFDKVLTNYTFEVKDNAGNVGTCTINVRSKNQYQLKTCTTYGGHVSKSEPDKLACAESLKETDYEYYRCTRYYYYSNTSVSAICGNKSASRTITVEKSTDKTSVVNKCLNEFKSTSNNGCYGLTIKSSTCESRLLSSYTKTTYTAKSCLSWNFGSWTNNKPAVADDNLNYDILTRTIYYSK